MQAYKEITEWDCGYKVTNHSYLINDKGKMIAYRPPKGEWKKLEHPLSFSKSRRRFVKLNLPEEFK